MKQGDQEAEKLNASNAAHSAQIMELERTVIDGCTACRLDGVKEG